MIKLAPKYVEGLKQTKRPFGAFQIEPTSEMSATVCCVFRNMLFKRMGIERYAHFKLQKNQQVL